MKMLIAAVALATLVGSPAFAQSYDPSVGSGNIAQPLSARPAAPIAEHRAARAHGAIASRPSRLYLYSGDRVPTAPDPNLQFQLHRESQQGQW